MPAYESAEPECFWVVWREGGGAPTRKHFEAEIAMEEAKRLARENPGAEFHVLCCVGTARKIDVEYVRRSASIPF